MIMTSKDGFKVKYNQIKGFPQLKYTTTVNRNNTVIEDNVHDVISTLYQCDSLHDDTTIADTEKNGVTLCDNDFKNLEPCSKNDCNTLNYLNMYICYIKDAFKVNNSLKGVNNYIDSAGTPSIIEFFKKFSLSNSDAAGLNTKHASLKWSIYTNHDVLLHIYVQMFLINATNVTNDYVDSINRLQVFNIRSETIISVINSNFLWQSVLLYAYNYISSTGINDSNIPSDIIKHAIRILRQIQFTSLSSKKVNDSSGLNWVFGFGPPTPMTAADIHDNSIAEKLYIKNMNNNIYHQFTEIFNERLPPPPDTFFDIYLDQDDEEYDFTGIQGFVAKSINTIKPSPYVKSRNENGKSTKMGEGMNALFDAYFASFGAGAGPGLSASDIENIKILCYQLLKFSGDSCHLNLSHIIQLAWDIIQKPGTISFGFSTGNQYVYAAGAPNDTGVDTIILTDERIVPLRCMLEGISFYVENFNKFAKCSNLTSEYIHYISDPKKRLQSLISTYYEYLTGSKIVDKLSTSDYYACYGRIKEYLDEHVSFELTDYATWGTIADGLTAVELNQKIIEYSQDIPVTKKIGMTSYVKYLQYIQRLSIFETLWANDWYIIFEDYFTKITDRNCQKQTAFSEDIEILVELLSLYYSENIVEGIEDYFVEKKDKKYGDLNYIVNTGDNLFTYYYGELHNKLREQLRYCDFKANFEIMFGYMYSEVNKYQSKSGRAGASSAPNPKINEEKPYWFSLFPYEKNSFTEDGLNDLKKILKGTHSFKQGGRSMEDTITIFVTCLSLLFRFFYKDGPEPALEAEELDDINDIATKYNEALKTYSDIFITKDTFQTKYKLIIEYYNEINYLFTSMKKGSIKKLMDEFNRDKKPPAIPPYESYDILWMDARMLPTLNKEKTNARKEYKKMCKILSSLIDEIKSMITFFNAHAKCLDDAVAGPAIIELDNISGRYKTYVNTNKLNNISGNILEQVNIKKMVNLDDSLLFKHTIQGIYRLSTAVPPVMEFSASIHNESDAKLIEIKGIRDEYKEELCKLFNTAEKGFIDGTPPLPHHGGASVGPETPLQPLQPVSEIENEEISQELYHIITPYIEVNLNSIEYSKSMEYIFRQIGDNDPIKFLLKCYNSISKTVEIDTYILELCNSPQFKAQYTIPYIYMKKQDFIIWELAINARILQCKENGNPINMTELYNSIISNENRINEISQERIKAESIKTYTTEYIIKYIYKLTINEISTEISTEDEANYSRFKQLWEEDTNHYKERNTGEIIHEIESLLKIPDEDIDSGSVLKTIHVEFNDIKSALDRAIREAEARATAGTGAALALGGSLVGDLEAEGAVEDAVGAAIEGEPGAVVEGRYKNIFKDISITHKYGIHEVLMILIHYISQQNDLYINLEKNDIELIITQIHKVFIKYRFVYIMDILHNLRQFISLIDTKQCQVIGSPFTPKPPTNDSLNGPTSPPTTPPLPPLQSLTSSSQKSQESISPLSSESLKPILYTLESPAIAPPVQAPLYSGKRKGRSSIFDNV